MTTALILNNKLPRSQRMAALARKFSDRVRLRQTDFSRRWLSRNLLRWKRLIHHRNPFQPDARDHA